MICPVFQYQEKPIDKDSVSQMTEKIEAWKKFVENWKDEEEEQTEGDYQQMTLPFVETEDFVEDNRDCWEIVVPGICNEKQEGKTNRELLQALSYKEAKDYCKYLQIPVLDTWTKQQMTDAVADMLAKHPQYILYVFLRRNMQSL